jgi:hypothetical protein
VSNLTGFSTLIPFWSIIPICTLLNDKLQIISSGMSVEKHLEAFKEYLFGSVLINLWVPVVGQNGSGHIG